MFKSLQNKRFLSLAALLAALCSMTSSAAPLGAQAQNTGEPDHVVVGSSADPAPADANAEQVEPFTREELEDMVSPVALYPDDLLAIVLPAAAYPLQIVQAARFLDDLENDDSLKPDQDWDESVVALLNYPEVVDLMNSDLEWTWQLGEAVINQEAEVIDAIETFRDRAVQAGNLKTDEHQVVSENDGTVEITPADPEVIYVPYYEPERVVVYQPYPAYSYYPRPYPVYYYPYPSGHYFDSGFFWGITTAYFIGWHSHHLNYYPWGYRNHPYFGYTYYSNNHYYHRPSRHHRRHRYAGGDFHDGYRWRPNRRHGPRPRHNRPWFNGRDNSGRDNSFVAGPRGSRIGRPGTFKRRPGFRGKIVNAGNTRFDSPVTTRGGKRSARPGKAQRPDRRDKSWKYNSTPETAYVRPKKRSPAKVTRNRPNRDQIRRELGGEMVAQNRTRRSSPVADVSRNLRGNRSGRSTKPRDDVVRKKVAPSRRSRPEGNRNVRNSRPDPVVSDRSRGRRVDAGSYSRVREPSPARSPRQSRPVSRPPASRTVSRPPERRPANRPPQSRAPESRPAPAASKPSPPSRSDRGRRESRGNRGENHRDGRGRHR